MIGKIKSLCKENIFIRLCALSLGLEIIIESLSRKSLFAVWRFIREKPAAFLLNIWIILLSLCVMCLFKRRKFLVRMSASIWLILAVINFVVTYFRVTPLSAVDFSLLLANPDILDAYIGRVEKLGIVLLIVLFAVILVKEWKKSRKTQIYVKGILGGVLTCALFLTTNGRIVHAGDYDDNFSNLVDAYEQYGFVYCFANSVIDQGISEPEGYSSAEMNGIMKKLSREEDKLPGEEMENPNIIFVQLESFFDLNRLKNVKCSENPNPVFTRLKKNYSHGYVTVPSIGAGTANTEFEMITGMSLDYFGTGEYPYKSVLMESTCESICYNLRELGYTSYAIHNNTQTFYGRDTVFGNLGFDNFIALENMDSIEYNPIGWAKDSTLTKPIKEALDDTEGKDFIYTITVQGHGNYPTEAVDPTQTIRVSGLETEEERNQYEYYANQIHETDAWVGELLEMLEERDEKTVVVLYGDHLPSLGIEKEDLKSGSLYQTEYVIWNNFGMEGEIRNLEAYQLNAYVLGCLGVNNGILTKFHQNYMDTMDEDTYQSQLQMLEYDMLYGDYYVYGGEPHPEVPLKLGLQEQINVSGENKV